MLLLSCLLVAAPAFADDGEAAEQAAGPSKVKLSFNDDFELRWWTFPDRRLPLFPDVAVYDYQEQVNRIIGRANADKWAFQLQLDEVALFSNRYYLDDVEVHERNLVGQVTDDRGTHDVMFNPIPFGFAYANLEKITFTYDTPTLSLTLGDTYAAFARGLALNLNRNVDIDLDTSIQGMKLVARAGAWDVTGVVGQLNRQQVWQDNPNVDIYGDRRHFVGAVRVERFGLGPADVGAHVAVYNFVDDTGWAAGAKEIATVPDAVVLGANTDLYGVLGLDWSAEGAFYTHPSDELVPGGTPDGYALYLSSAAYLGPTTWLLEAKRYKNSQIVNTEAAKEQYQVAFGPTLEYERVITEDSSAALGSNDIWGARLRGDLTIGDGAVIPYVQLGVFRDLDQDNPLTFARSHETILHPMVGMEFIKDHSALLTNVGVRTDIRDDPAQGRDLQLHADADIKAPVYGPVTAAINLYGERFLWGDNAFEQHDYTEIETAWTLAWSSDVALTWFTDYTDNPILSSKGNLSEHLYGAAELQVKPTDAITIKAFYGAYKAGLRCSGGQCRQLPGFQGGRVSLTGKL